MANKTNLKTLVVMAVILLGFSCTTAAGATIYVDADRPTGGNGTTWANAYKYLQDALDDAESGDEIWVATGTYCPDDDDANHPDGSGLRTATFQLINGVAIYGGFAGYGEPDPYQRNIELYETILTGDIAGNDVPVDPCDLLDDPCRADNSYTVVTGSGTDATAVLDGFTITAGNANGPSGPDRNGGGMCNWPGSPTVTNCTFIANSAYFAAGAMFNANNSSPTVTNCIFGGNLAGVRGGGMTNWYYSSPTVTNCTFTGNSAYQKGGGMYNDNNSSPTVTNCTFSGNSADWGGGMYNWDNSSPTLSNCILWGNTAASGAQIYNDGTSSATVSYCDVQGGWAGTGNIPDDPLFVDADGDDNIVGTEDDNLRLSGYSPCIDAGDNTRVPIDITTDLDGSPRFFDDPYTDDTGNGTPPIVDMGAYERNIPSGEGVCGDVYHPYPPGDLSGPEEVPDCRVDFYDFVVFAEHWLECTAPECD